MLTPSHLLKRVGVGGGLVPFFKCVCVYFVAGGGAPSAGAVAAKVAPVLCLLLFVLAHHGTNMHKQGWYARRIAAGLALSSLGDALLVFPQHFVAGMAAFAGAQLSYTAAFRFDNFAPHIALPCYAATALFMMHLDLRGELRLLVPLYGALLCTAVWRAGARGGAAARGGALFLLSDAALAMGLFSTPLPYNQVVVMTTYYLAQLFIALSVLERRPGSTTTRFMTTSPRPAANTF